MKNSGLGTCHSEGEHYLNINCARLDKEIGQQSNHNDHNRREVNLIRPAPLFIFRIIKNLFAAGTAPV